MTDLEALLVIGWFSGWLFTIGVTNGLLSLGHTWEGWHDILYCVVILATWPLALGMMVGEIAARSGR